VCYVELPNAKIEFIQQLDPDTPLGRWLAENPKGGLYHIALSTDDIAHSVREVAKRGTTTDWKQPSVLADGTQILFFDPNTTLNVRTEFCKAPQETGTHTRVCCREFGPLPSPQSPRQFWFRTPI
jgi:hypothetical protein